MTRTVTFKWRRDTAANFTTENPTLAEGEPGYETDTEKLKIGDGTTAWTSLSYFDAGGAFGDVSGPASSTDNAIAIYNGTTGKTLQNSGVLISDDGDVTIGSTGRFIATSANGETGSIWRDNNALVIDSGTGGYFDFKVAGTTQLWITTTGDLALRNGNEGWYYNGGNTEYGRIYRNNTSFVIDSNTGGTLTMLGSGNLAQTISTAGITTFASFPITPSAAPTTDYQVANKKYVDDTAVGSTYTASNSGTGSGVFYQKTGTDFEFMSIKQGANMTITTVGSEMTFASSAGVGSQLTTDLDVNGNYIDGYTASRALETTANGSIKVSDVTATELNYLDGVTSAIQTQFGTKVTGPAGATDNAIPRFDGATGYIVQNSGVTITDNGSISGTGNAGITSSGSITFRSDSDGVPHNMVLEEDGSLTIPSTIDGRDLATDGAKLDLIEALADVTDTANVTSAGALMDSECTSLADVKALNQSVISGATPTFTGTNFTGIPHTGVLFTKSLPVAQSTTTKQWCYSQSNGSMALTDADAVATAGPVWIAMATETIGTVGSNCTFQYFDEYTGSSGDWSIGSVYYLSTTQGSITPTAPSGNDDVIRIVGHCVGSSAKFMIRPSQTWAIGSA